MKARNELSRWTARVNLPTASAAALAVAVCVSMPQPARAEPVTPPPVPDNIRILEGNRAFLVGHAIGTQNYSCLPAGVDAAGQPRFAWTLFTPQATLFGDNLKEVTTHYFSPNPFADGIVRATWQDSKDTSTVWGKVVPGDSSTDAAFVAPGAIAWLRVTVVGAEDGPTGGGTLTPTTFIQRVNTSGGVAPSSGCASSMDVGNQAFVPYTADYFFYEKTKGNHDDD
jgi:hypothetical protein